MGDLFACLIVLFVFDFGFVAYILVVIVFGRCVYGLRASGADFFDGGF